MKVTFTPFFYFITFLMTAGGILSACTSTVEGEKNTGRVHYTKMSGGIAMPAIFPLTIVDTTYYNSGSIKGEIEAIEIHWAWRAPTLDSLRARYPDASISGSMTTSIPVYYYIGDITESPSTYKISYQAVLPKYPHEANGELGPNSGTATFLKDEKGWYLASNVYNELSVKKSSTPTSAKTESESVDERLFTLRWSNETHLSTSMQCMTQGTKNLTSYGSTIFEVPNGQVWVPIEGESKESADASSYTLVKIDADDGNANSACYLGELREIPNNPNKNVERAKDEFHKYYGGTKVRFWGFRPYNEITILVKGPGPLPNDAIVSVTASN